MSIKYNKDCQNINCLAGVITHDGQSGKPCKYCNRELTPDQINILKAINKRNWSIRSYNNLPYIFKHTNDNKDIPQEQIALRHYNLLYNLGYVTDLYIKNKSTITELGKSKLKSI